MTDAEWALIVGLIPSAKRGGNRRWVVERSIAWLNRCRAKDGENLSRTALALLRLASIRRMMRRRCHP